MLQPRMTSASSSIIWSLYGTDPQVVRIPLVARRSFARMESRAARPGIFRPRLVIGAPGLGEGEDR